MCARPDLLLLQARRVPRTSLTSEALSPLCLFYSCWQLSPLLLAFLPPPTGVSAQGTHTPGLRLLALQWLKADSSDPTASAIISPVIILQMCTSDLAPLFSSQHELPVLGWENTSNPVFPKPKPGLPVASPHPWTASPSQEPVALGSSFLSPSRFSSLPLPCGLTPSPRVPISVRTLLSLAQRKATTSYPLCLFPFPLL